ncbi:ankyrin repeat-containing domain protein [Xylogone sp. PMI_703]|nr:ankyrin repeat-containing domain protein [Xylogone sp. PMI_703]
MDKLSQERLVYIARSLDLQSLLSWILVAKRYHAALKDEFYVKALALDREAGWPCHLLRATLLGQATNSLKALLQDTDLAKMNNANIDVQNLFSRDIYEPSSSSMLYRPDSSNKSKGPHHTTLLHIACRMCSTDVVKLILQRGANPSILDTLEWAPIHLAAWCGKPSIIPLLLDAGADVNIKGGHGWRTSKFVLHYDTTPFLEAAAQGHLSTLELLLEAGADPKARLKSGSDALNVAAIETEEPAVIERLLRIGCYDKESLTKSLTWAARHQSSQAVRILLEAGGEPQNALLKATENNRLDSLTLLLDAGADPRQCENIFAVVRSAEAARIILTRYPGMSASSPLGRTSGTQLESLYEHGKMENAEEVEEIALLLIEDGCRICEPDPVDKHPDNIATYRSVLQYAALWGHPRVAKAILSRTRSLVNWKLQQGFTALHYAACGASKNKLACVKLLVEHGADIHAASEDGQTVFGSNFSMVMHPLGTPRPVRENAEVARYLISVGIDIEAPSDGNKPLICALMTENDPSAIILMDAGADIYVRSTRYLSTLHIAAQNGCLESLDRLLKADHVDRLLEHHSKDTLLHLAVQQALMKHDSIQGYTLMMAHILLGHTEVSVEDVAGDKAADLEPLAHTGRMETIRRLCGKGIVDPGVRNSHGFTPVDLVRDKYSRARKPGFGQVGSDGLSTLFEEADMKWPRFPMVTDVATD